MEAKNLLLQSDERENNNNARFFLITPTVITRPCGEQYMYMCTVLKWQCLAHQEVFIFHGYLYITRSHCTPSAPVG